MGDVTDERFHGVLFLPHPPRGDGGGGQILGEAGFRGRELGFVEPPGGERAADGLGEHFLQTAQRPPGFDPLPESEAKGSQREEDQQYFSHPVTAQMYPMPYTVLR